MENQRINYSLKLTVLFFFSWGLIFLDRLAISYLTPAIIPVMNLTNADIGKIGFVTTGCYAVSAVIFGALSDKLGYRKRLLIPFVFGTAIFSGLSSCASSFNQLLFFRGLVGISEGPIMPLMMSMVAQSSSKSKFGQYAGIINMGAAVIAGTLGPIFITQLLNITSWNMAFLISSLPSFLMVLLLIKFTKETTNTEEKNTETNSMNLASFAEIFKYKNIIICGISAVLFMSAYWTIMIFSSVYWVNIAQISVEKMGFISSGMGFVCIAWTIIIPKLSDNFGRKNIMIISSLFATAVPLFMYLMPGSELSIYIYIIFGGVLGSTTPLFFTIIPMESVPQHLKATSNGLMLACGEVLGGAVFPIIVGKIADVKGLPFIMLIASVLTFSGMLISFLLAETNSRNVEVLEDVVS